MRGATSRSTYTRLGGSLIEDAEICLRRYLGKVKKKKIKKATKLGRAKR